jgi:hypothetical protein
MNKIRVYATCWWETDETLFEIIKEYGFGSHIWKNIEFTLDDDYDRIIILRTLNKKSKSYDPRKAITFFTEPSDTKDFLQHESSVVLSFLPLPFWNFVKQEKKEKILQLGGIKKTKLLSSITSDLYELEGHQKRVDFILHLDGVIDEGLDIFGKNNSGKLFTLLDSYRGFIADKYDALWPYKYHFACENSFMFDYYTEKLVDPIIAECLCFYDGCCNIADFIDERAFIKINVSNPKETIETMIEGVQNNEWRKRIKYIRQQKQRLLYDLNPLNIIWMAVNEKDVLKDCKLEHV